MHQINKLEPVRPSKPASEYAFNAGGRCPITLDSLNTLGDSLYPAADGYVYEKNAFIEWLKKSDLSPMTRKPLDADQRVLVGYSIKPSKTDPRVAASRKVGNIVVCLAIHAVANAGMLSAGHLIPGLDTPTLAHVQNVISGTAVIHAIVGVAIAFRTANRL